MPVPFSPNIKVENIGLSSTSLSPIRYWYKFYNSEENGLQPVSQMELVENMVKSIPWGHNQRIMYKCSSVQEALFYVQKTMDNGWSRNVLEHQIDSGLYNRQGKAVSNFQLKLPEAQSDLAQQTLKDPYNFDLGMLSYSTPANAFLSPANILSYG